MCVIITRQGLQHTESWVRILQLLFWNAFSGKDCLDYKQMLSEHSTWQAIGSYVGFPLGSGMLANRLQTITWATDNPVHSYDYLISTIIYYILSNHAWDENVNQRLKISLIIIPPAQKSCWGLGVSWFHSICPSVCPSDKQENYKYKTVNFPDLSGNIPHGAAYAVYASEVIRYARLCKRAGDFKESLGT